MGYKLKEVKGIQRQVPAVEENIQGILSHSQKKMIILANIFRGLVENGWSPF